MENYFSHLIKRIAARFDRTLTEIKDSLNLSPKDISWKIRWRMRNDRNPLFIEIQDKYKVKEYASARGVKSADTYYVTDKPETIPFDSLPDKYFIKANHGCKWNILYSENEFFLYGDGEDLIGRNNTSTYKLTREECVQYCNSWMSTIYSKREWAYQFITPKIMIEETLIQYNGGELMDYRCFTFNGKVGAIYLDSATFNIYNQKVFVDSTWKELKFTNDRELRPYILPEKPENLSEIVDIAERLGQGLDFVRVDLYNTTRGIVLGEMSIYPMAGKPNSPTPDLQFNKWLGDHWILPG